MRKKIAATIILLLEFLLFCNPIDAKISESSLSTARNRIASLEDRKKAIDQLKEIQDPEVTKNLIEMLRDSKEPVTLRNHVLHALIQGNDLWLDVELKKILNDPLVSVQSRQLALQGLWRLKSNTLHEELIQLAQKSTETKELRRDAIKYLGLSDIEKWPPNFWGSLYSQKTTPSLVRMTALNSMEQLGLTDELRTTLIKILGDSLESSELKKSAVLMGSRLLPPFEFEGALVSLISKPENAIEMKRFALDHLSAMNLDSASLLSLRQILSHERSAPLAQELEEVLSKYKEPSKSVGQV